MPNSDVVVGQSSKARQVAKYQIGNGYRRSDVTLLPDEMQDLLGETLTQTSSRTCMSYEKLVIPPADRVDNNEIRVEQGPTKFIWAFGGNNELTLQRHAQAGSFVIDFATCSSEQARTVKGIGRSAKVLVLHAALMMVAWLVLVPASVTLARFGKSKFPKKWFLVHKVCSFAVAVLTIVAFLVLKPSIPNAASLHLHGYLGFFIIGTAVVVMPALGVLRPPLPQANPFNDEAIAKTHVKPPQEERARRQCVLCVSRSTWKLIHASLGELIACELRQIVTLSLFLLLSTRLTPVLSPLFFSSFFVVYFKKWKKKKKVFL